MCLFMIQPEPPSLCSYQRKVKNSFGEIFDEFSKETRKFLSDVWDSSLADLQLPRTLFQALNHGFKWRSTFN